jgi:hypothetical protein
MKKYKQFRAEQQYITEVGPFASAMMTAMAVTGLGIAGWKLFKTAKEKIKGYRETKQEKKENQENGVFVNIKKWNDEAGKIISEPVEIAAKGSSAANMSNDEITKKEKELQKKEDPRNKAKQGEYERGEKSAETERGGIEDVKDAEEYFDNNGEAPAGWRNAGDKDKPELMTTKDFEKKKEKKPKKKLGTGTAGARTGMAARTKPKDLDKAGVESKVLSFGEFITEGVMNDLLKAGKSKKDSEISLDDGADIPIDPLTSQILVKYIEGLSSSEKNRTIQQIQRTERAFMKVLGKAHENT